MVLKWEEHEAMPQGTERRWHIIGFIIINISFASQFCEHAFVCISHLPRTTYITKIQSNDLFCHSPAAGGNIGINFPYGRSNCTTSSLDTYAVHFICQRHRRRRLRCWHNEMIYRNLITQNRFTFDVVHRRCRPLPATHVRWTLFDLIFMRLIVVRT